MTDVAPLILTVLFAPDAAAELDALRQRYFPPERNWIPAHVTLFHHLPGARLRAVLDDLRAVCGTARPLVLTADRPRFLGHGVAIEIESEGLRTLRKELATRWAADLGAQDRQAFRPHVTIQNKVPSGEARRLYDALCAGWQPRTYSAEGLQLWHYQGGPWSSAAAVRFG